MTRLAAVDCGTNSIRLLIVDASTEDGALVQKEVLRTMKIVRLGEGVDATGSFAPAALARTEAALAEYVEIMKREHVQDVRMVATSATRDVDNREEFFRMTGTLLGQIRPGARAEVISGEEEALLSFRGAVADLPPDQGPFCVIDLGGGSTEFVIGTADGQTLGSHSAQMGCVRITERIMRSDPPTVTEVEIAEDFVAKKTQEVATIVPLEQARTFVGCAGTFTTIAALALGLESYDSRLIHDARLRFDALRVLTAELITMTSAQRGVHPVIHAGRADVIAGGCVAVNGILDMIEQHTGQTELVVSEKDILDGIIEQLALNF